VVPILLLTLVTVLGLTPGSNAIAAGSPAAAALFTAKPPGNPTSPGPVRPAPPFRACRPDHGHFPRICHGHGDHDLTVVAPDTTDRASIVLEGTAPASAVISVQGGLLPARATAAADGTFSVEVALRPETANLLTVTATTSKRTSRVTVVITEHSPAAAGTLKGTVLDVGSGQAVAGATVAYGATKATTDAQGAFQLTGLPDGLVVVTVSAPGSLPGTASATLDQGTAPAAGLLLQKFAAPTAVTSAGGTFTGPGWEIDVPRNAVTRTTNLEFTQLVFTGNEDSYGMPYVDLSPSGQRFAKPVTVAIDPAVLGVDDPSQAQLLGVNDTGAATVLPSTVSGSRLVTTLTTFDGERIYTLRRNPDGDPANFCTPFKSAALANGARAVLRVTLLPFLRVMIGAGSSRLWGEYLAGGVATTVRELESDNEFLTGFRDAAESQDALKTVMDQLAQQVSAMAPPTLSSPDSPTTEQLSDFPGMLGQNVPIDYGADRRADRRNPLTLAANTAGGISLSSVATGSVLDSRSFSVTSSSCRQRRIRACSATSAWSPA
jgi:hypothetical protein